MNRNEEIKITYSFIPDIAESQSLLDAARKEVEDMIAQSGNNPVDIGDLQPLHQRRPVLPDGLVDPLHQGEVLTAVQEHVPQLVQEG